MIVDDGEVVVGELGERLAPPQRVGLGQHLDGPLQLARRRQRPPVGGAPLEPLDVDGVRRQIEDVPVAAHHHQVRRAQRPAQLGRQALQPVAHRGGRILTPQRVDQVLGRDDPTDVQGQARRAAPAAWPPRP